MRQSKAIQLAIFALIAEKRKHHQAYLMFLSGSPAGRPGHAKYLEITEALRILSEMLEKSDRPSSNNRRLFEEEKEEEHELQPRPTP